MKDVKITLRREIESRGLTEEGIYRVPGVVGEIRRLKSAFDESMLLIPFLSLNVYNYKNYFECI